MACFLLLRSVFPLLRFVLVAVVLVLSSLFAYFFVFCFFCLLLCLCCLACLSVYCVLLSVCLCGLFCCSGLFSVCCCGLPCGLGSLFACSFVNKFMLFGFFSSSVFACFFRCRLEITLRFVYEPRFRVLGYRLFFIKIGHVCGLCGHLLPFRLIKFLKGVGFLGYFGVLKNNWFVEN